jgi:hypothetical protein
MQRFVNSLVLALVIAGVAACGRGEAPPAAAVDQPGVIAVTGTVQFFSLESGFFAIRAEDGKTYDPINLPREYQKDGLRVRFKGKLRPDLAGVHMVGPLVEIVTIEQA